jgi:TetR/AcrR family transcriptional regulator, regulator of biofilm formation and stress response
LTPAAADGRRARGEARRLQLVEATLTVLERDGLAGVTHRAVAEQAGVSLASASYHYSGIHELILVALLHATEQLGERLAVETSNTLGALARLIAEEVNQRPGLMLAEYELYLYAARHPELRAAATAWLDVLADHFAPKLDATGRRAFKATVEGLFLHALLDDGPAVAKEIEATLRAAWPRTR